MSSSLGKGCNNRPSDPPAGGDRPGTRHKPEIVNQEGLGPASFGRPALSSEKLGSGSQASSVSNKAKGKGQPGKQTVRQPLSTALREQIFKRDHYQCCNCEASPLTDKKVRLETDHIVPVSRGGTNDPHNLQTLCHNCNQVKRASLV